MCGIIGYIGTRPVVPVLLDGLRRLEYRGYDSAGIAFHNDGRLTVIKSPGKLTRLAEKCSDECQMPSDEQELITHHSSGVTEVGIGHTRWATHGEPSFANAHPHVDCEGRLAVVHNGIIENYLSLKARLVANGHRFCSTTDTEVIPHLIEEQLSRPGTLAVRLEEAVRQALSQLEGSIAIAVMSRQSPAQIIGARRHCPLIIGIGRGEYFLASDIPALLPYTKQVIILGDDEMAVITDEGIDISRITDGFAPREDEQRSKAQGARSAVHGAPGQSGSAREKGACPVAVTVDWDVTQAEKCGYPHFMLKEIFEQPDAVQETLRGRISADKHQISLDDVPADLLHRVKKVYVVACGTSYHAGLVGRYMIEELSGVPVEVDMASEFRYRQHNLNSETLLIAISQSGETADTLAAIRQLEDARCELQDVRREQQSRLPRRASRIPILSITNVVGSSVTQLSDGVIYTRAGPEIGVASTKTFTSQLVALFLFALHLAQAKNRIGADECRAAIEDLLRLPEAMREVLSRAERIKQLAEKLSDRRDFIYLGRWVSYPIALEGALKLKEIAYINAQGYAAGEMKHGPIALIENGLPVVAIVPKDRVYEKMLGNIEEAKARKACLVALATQGDSEMESKAHEVISLPKAHPLLTPILSVLPLQLLAYYVATLKGCDVDQPRNLAKSVTVE